MGRIIGGVSVLAAMVVLLVGVHMDVSITQVSMVRTSGRVGRNGDASLGVIRVALLCDLKM